MVQSLIPLSLDRYVAEMDTVAPSIFEQPHDVDVEIGNRGRFRVRGRGFPLHYVWTENGLPIPDSDQPLLTLNDLSLNDDGNRYAVTVWNEEGEEKSREARLHIKPFSGPAVSLAATGPAIDGIVDEPWTTCPPLPISCSLIGNMPTEDDLSATFRLLWDETYLYILVEVTDDVCISRADPDYFRDGVEVHLDCANDKNEYYDENDCMLRYNWTTDLTILRGDTEADIPHAQSDKGHGYVMEIAWPWALCGHHPAAGGFFGLDIHVNDNDTSRRESKLSWHSRADDAYWNPAVFGTLQLSDIR
jgi:hypothetical protein